MTESEYPEIFRGLIGEADPASAVVPSSPLPANPAAPEFTSRRAAREAGAYRLAASESAPAGRRDAKATRSRPSGAARRGRVRDAVRAGVGKSGTPGWRRRVSSAGVMTLVVGLFATLTIPAFAQQDTLAENAEPLSGQTLEVTASTTDAAAVIRDSYGTTSASDLRKLYADAIRQQNLQAYLNSGARELGDDYPWPDMLSDDQGGGLSPLNYYYRECVDFVAWRLNRDAGSTSAPFRWTWSNLASGSAWKWKSEWEAHGWPVSSTPVVGAVAWQPGGNHVAYVSGILGDGSVVLEEYNYNVDHRYGQRIVAPGSMVYLYPPS